MLKAWLFGFSIAAVAQGLWLASLLANIYLEPLFVLLWVSPFAAALAAAYHAPQKGMLMGTSMALVVAALTLLVNTLFQLTGTAVDFPGARGGWILFVVTLVYSVVVAALGAAAGQWLARRRATSERT